MMAICIGLIKKAAMAALSHLAVSDINPNIVSWLFSSSYSSFMCMHTAITLLLHDIFTLIYVMENYMCQYTAIALALCGSFIMQSALHTGGSTRRCCAESHNKVMQITTRRTPPARFNLIIPIWIPHRRRSSGNFQKVFNSSCGIIFSFRMWLQNSIRNEVQFSKLKLVPSPPGRLKKVQFWGDTQSWVLKHELVV